MYLQFFGLNEPPFSITPDPRFVFFSTRHEDALAHLRYGITEGGGGGFVQLTGEVGTGKTTLSRCLLEDLPDNVTVALILNPRLEPVELLEAICDELNVSTEGAEGSLRKLVDLLNAYLLKAHGEGRNVVLMIDEAQNLSPQSLEQVRLLTNLETATKKLLQIVLLGQPELRELLARADLRQLSQRITARYHLTALDQQETADYLLHRLKVAGAIEHLFIPSACRALHRLSGGVPRVINILAERSLVAAYAGGHRRVTPRLVKLAAREVLPESTPPRSTVSPLAAGLAGAAVVAVLGGWLWSQQRDASRAPPATPSATLGTALPLPTPTEPGPPAFVLEWDAAWRALPDAGSPPAAATCPSRLPPGLRCQSARGRVESVTELNRPVLLQLSVRKNQYAVARFTESAAEVFGADDAQWIETGELTALWSGHYFDVFPVPGYVPEVLREGDRGPGVLWIKQVAARAQPAYPADPADPYFGPALREWTAAFQRAHGLEDDGLVGPETVQLLARFQDPAQTADEDSG